MTDFDRDVVVVGGGVAGPSAGVFLARYGLDTLIVDRGPSSIQQCAYLENFLGFPGGIDVSTFLALARDHAREAGCDLIEDMVVSVERQAVADCTDGFRVETQDGRAISTRRVVAAAKYDGSYLEPLDADGSMFTEATYDGQTTQHFDPDYVDSEGRTPVDGLYVAGPLGGADDQAIVAAGHGAIVARSLLEDHREAEGYWEGVARFRDWQRKEGARGDDWADVMETWFAELVPEDADSDETERMRAEIFAEQDEKYLTEAEVERRWRDGQRRILDHLDDDVIREYLDERSS